MNSQESPENMPKFSAELAALQIVFGEQRRQEVAIIKLLETTTHHLVEHTNLPSPERTALLDQLREVKESFGVVPCGTVEE